LNGLELSSSAYLSPTKSNFTFAPPTLSAISIQNTPCYGWLLIALRRKKRKIMTGKTEGY